MKSSKLNEDNLTIPFDLSYNASMHDNNILKDYKKLSINRNGYALYKSHGWKSTFIKFKEKKEMQEKIKQSILEKILQQ